MHDRTHSPACPPWCAQPAGHREDVDWTCHFGRIAVDVPGHRVEVALSVADYAAPEPLVLLDVPGSATAEILTPAQAHLLAAALTTAADRAEGHR
ncbi:DUF6907 domain-containing protein [Pseudonocardia parietis]|uniref:Uncharacterized protein n=1 Tax=Pseudonocardia parietis TaxID=570936 RepID=A0ABS4W3W3_9PSEU|nr:hypothetical protein [Pseudonocardia parietis]MBP2370676.1 hypothetical protein [Pseudonocardia parietis]